VSAPPAASDGGVTGSGPAGLAQVNAAANGGQGSGNRTPTAPEAGARATADETGGETGPSGHGRPLAGSGTAKTAGPPQAAASTEATGRPDPRITVIAGGPETMATTPAAILATTAATGNAAGGVERDTTRPRGKPAGASVAGRSAGTLTILPAGSGVAPADTATPGDDSRFGGSLLKQDPEGSHTAKGSTVPFAPTGAGQPPPQSTSAPLVVAGPPGTAPRPLVEQISVHIVKAVNAGTDRIDIRLEPASLGRIEVRLEVSGDGRVRAAIAADSPDTLNLLKSEARGLERALQDAGLKSDFAGLSFHLRDREARSGRDRQARFVQPLAVGTKGDTTEVEARTRPPAYSTLTHRGASGRGLDIHA
jgi:flagellar hook-length control protein FliK